MTDLIMKALSAKRESKNVEFKHSFNPNSPGEWCELVKDFIAIANSGGGIIVFGLDSLGEPTGESVEKIVAIDPADIENKISKYTRGEDFEFEIRFLEKKRHQLIAFIINSVSIPLVFEKPGTYDIGNGKQQTAFRIGSIYFRHGAKSEPGTRDDIRRVIERQLDKIRESWIKGVRKVVLIPPKAKVDILPSASHDTYPILVKKANNVNDPNVMSVKFTRDPALATGSFIHEEVSDEIFDEINNVVDANRILAKGQKKFFLGEPVYYRIYAEREHVQQPKEIIGSLLYNGIFDFYAPALYWIQVLPENFFIQVLKELYFFPTNRHAYYLMRIALLLGPDFSNWLFEKWNYKWKNHRQRPSVYWTLKKMIEQMKVSDPRYLAARGASTTRIQFEENSLLTIQDLMDKPDQATTLVSRACMQVFKGNNDYKSVARNLDFLAYGQDIQKRAPRITKTIIKLIGEQVAGEILKD